MGISLAFGIRDAEDVTRDGKEVGVGKSTESVMITSIPSLKDLGGRSFVKGAEGWE